MSTTDNNKRSNKSIIITACICATVIISLICVLAFTDPIVGRVKLNKIRGGAEACDVVVISDPLYDASFSRGAEVILTGDEARDIADRFLTATDDMSYEGTVDGIKGFWDTRIDFCTDDEKLTIYLHEDAVYVTNSKGYLFEIEDGCEETYEAFYNKVLEILDEQKAS